MKKDIVYFLLFCFSSLQGFSQSFIKTYADFAPPYYGINVLPIERSRTAVLGLYIGTVTIGTVVDSIGNKIYNTNYIRNIKADGVSNFIQTSNGFTFYHSSNSWSLSGNDLMVDFINDSLRQTNSYLFQSACYDCNTANISLNYVKNEGVFFTGTVWGKNSNFGPWKYNAYSGMITKLDSSGNLVWTNNWGPWDSANPCQVFNTIITSDSSIAVMGGIYGTIHLKKYSFSGGLQFDYPSSLLQNNVSGYTQFIREGSNLYGELVQLKKNLLAFGTVTDTTTHRYQLALEIVNLSGSLVNQKKFVLNKDTGNITPITVYAATDSTAILNYTVAGSTLNYYLTVNYIGDSLGGFTLPAYTVSTFDSGNILCALDTNNTILVREYSPSRNMIYKYTYKPFDSLNICNAISPLQFPGRFVLTGSSNNNLLIIRQDTSSTILSVNNPIKTSSSVEIYPNPSNGKFIIAFVRGQNSDSYRDVFGTIEIYNEMGQRVLKQILRFAQDHKVMDLSNQPNGVYFYRVLSENGALIGEGKVVIEK